jgi:hypothetical protein
MATVKAIDANPTRNNGATVVMGGAVAADDTAVTNAPDMTITGAGKKGNPAVYGPSATTGTSKIVDAGNFATQPAGHYVMRGGNVTRTLAGVAYLGLIGGAADHGVRRSIHSLTTRSTVLIDSWDYATGVPTYNVGNPSSDDFGSDHAAAPTAAIPGELVFLEGDPDPTQADYEARTQW